MERVGRKYLGIREVELGHEFPRRPAELAARLPAGGGLGREDGSSAGNSPMCAPIHGVGEEPGAAPCLDLLQAEREGGEERGKKRKGGGRWQGKRPGPCGSVAGGEARRGSTGAGGVDERRRGEGAPGEHLLGRGSRRLARLGIGWIEGRRWLARAENNGDCRVGWIGRDPEENGVAAAHGGSCSRVCQNGCYIYQVC